MGIVCFCGKCGNLYLKHYSFCPYCGLKNPLGGDADLFLNEAASGRKGAKAVRQAYFDRLVRLEKRLNLMDRELDAFMVDRR